MTSAPLPAVPSVPPGAAVHIAAPGASARPPDYL